MKMSLDVAQMRVSRDLQEAEAAMDEALLRQNSLLGTMVSARRESEVEPFLGQDAILGLAKAQLSLITASNDLARVHGRLRRVQEETVGYAECPENKPIAHDEREHVASAI